MKATIWHNPRCSKSRAALTSLEEAVVEVTVIDYFSSPPAATDLAQLAARTGLGPRALLRPDAPSPTDDAVFAAIAADPSLLERPLVETTRGVVLARPPERVREII